MIGLLIKKHFQLDIIVYRNIRFAARYTDEGYAAMNKISIVYLSATTGATGLLSGIWTYVAAKNIQVLTAGTFILQFSTYIF